MALSEGNEKWGNTLERESDYSISICGELWLIVQSNGKSYYVISGPRSGERRYSLNQIKEKLKRV
jgi:hypothetical protein